MADVKREDAPYSDRVTEEEIAVENAGNEQDWLNDESWRGVYPGHCIDPETCRGYTHCPRNYSCVE